MRVSGNFSLTPGTVTTGYTTVEVTAEGDKVHASDSFGNTLSGDKDAMGLLGAALAQAAGHNPAPATIAAAAVTAVPLNTQGWYGDTDDDGNVVVYDALGNVVFTLRPIKGDYTVA